MVNGNIVKLGLFFLDVKYFDNLFFNTFPLLQTIVKMRGYCVFICVCRFTFDLCTKLIPHFFFFFYYFLALSFPLCASVLSARDRGTRCTDRNCFLWVVITCTFKSVNYVFIIL